MLFGERLRAAYERRSRRRGTAAGLLGNERRQTYLVGTIPCRVVSSLRRDERAELTPLQNLLLQAPSSPKLPSVAHLSTLDYRPYLLTA